MFIFECNLFCKIYRAKLSFALLLITVNISLSQEINFPKFQKKDSLYSIGKYNLQDEYFQLEYNNETTKKWLKEQELLSEKYLKNSPGISERLNKINEYENKDFILLGDRYFNVLYSSDGLGIYCKKSLSKSVTPIITNNDIVWEKGKHAIINQMQVSSNNQYLAYSYSINGSEKFKIKVYDLNENRHLKDTLDNIGIDDIQWYNNGFFYKKHNTQNIYYHILSDNQERDSLIFSSEKVKSTLNDFIVLNNENYLIIKQNNLKTKLFNVYYLNLK